MRSVLEFDCESAVTPSDEFADTHVRTPKPYAEHVISKYSSTGDRVADPFAGFGTMLVVAEELNRVPFGIEYESKRVEFIRERIDHSEEIRHGSATEFSTYDPPTVDLCFTSPPFMTKEGTNNPFENYEGEGTYDEYLDNVEEVFEQVGEHLSPEGVIAIDVSNMMTRKQVTTLAWDIQEALSETFRFRGEDVVTWTDSRGGYGYDYNYCLFFTKS